MNTNIVHKFEIGDIVLFKNKFASPTYGVDGLEGTWAKVVGIAPSYNNKPHYYLDGKDDCAAYPETLFSGRYEE